VSVQQLRWALMQLGMGVQLLLLLVHFSGWVCSLLVPALVLLNPSLHM
jgi:hypothetical protein